MKTPDDPLFLIPYPLSYLRIKKSNHITLYTLNSHERRPKQGHINPFTPRRLRYTAN